MKRILILLLLASFCMAGSGEQFTTQTSSSTLELASNWQLLAVMALIISVILVAIAYAIGIGLEMPEMKAWAGTELVQIITNAIIVATLIVTLALIDLVVLGVAVQSGLTVDGCTESGNATSCLQGVTDQYLDSYIDTAESKAKGILSDNMFAAGMAGRRIGISCITIFCAQIATTMTIGGHYIVKSDMYMILFDHYANLLASMEAQKFFVNAIAFRMGPVILAIGIVARSFFLTRKLGGLLIAIAVGIMFFFPGMYIFDWVTLDNVLNGDKASAGEEGADCPAECKVPVPLAYAEGGGNLNDVQSIYNAFSADDSDKAADIANGDIESAIGSAGDYDGKVITSCYYDADTTECPIPCRELPYPSIPLCLNLSEEIPQNCAGLPAKCKVVRYVEDIDEVEVAACPDDCKVVPPLKSNCDIDNCASSSPDCRVAKRVESPDFVWRPEKECDDSFEGCDDIKERCNWAADCPASLAAALSCTYVIPESGQCDEVCADCPSECRVGGSGTDLPDHCSTDSCDSCTDGCKAQWSTIEALDVLAQGNGTCTSCPLNKRLIYHTLPESYYSGGCSYTSCPVEYRAAVPFQACEMCLFTKESYVYDPPIDTGCTESCKPPDNTPVSDPSAYTQIGDTGLVGLGPVQDISKLMIPAYLLPLFNIVATIVFIKGLSDILGGDIEIPGLSKVF
ncbi:MAG: hypothetical protein PHF60_01985 [Candidatus ainarchaeum sp.]|nr:hypothetical protein [Candidatus ainarchaeum sp.]